MCVMLY